MTDEELKKNKKIKISISLNESLLNYFLDGTIVFCSPNCVKAYLQKEKNNWQLSQIKHIFKLLLKQVYDIKYSELIIPAGPRETLKLFNKNGISIEQFR
jgi:hypothetical protein